MKRNASILFFLSVVIVSCSNHADNKSTTDKPMKADQTTTQPTGISIANGTKADSPNATFELLQGKWQSIDDANSYIIFENNNRKDIGGGMESCDVEPFVLSDRCLNESDKDTNVPAEKNKYITCPDADMCWYIVDLNKSALTLSYMGRGNILTYKRVE
jgi:hypothetical protein